MPTDKFEEALRATERVRAVWAMFDHWFNESNDPEKNIAEIKTAYKIFSFGFSAIGDTLFDIENLLQEGLAE